MKSVDTYTKNQIEKLGNTLIFLCDHIKPASKTHLLKLVFIIEELAIKKFGIPFFNLRFDVWKLGPVSKDLFVELSGESYLLSSFVERKNNGDNTYILAKKEFCDDEFNDNEINLLNEVVERFKYCTANELINFTHKRNTPWYNTALRHGILDLMEKGLMTTSNIEIDMSELIENDEDKLFLYKNYKEFLSQSKELKLL